MRKPISISKGDYARILLTEVLPHELPLFFSNDRLYAYTSLPVTKVPALVRALLDFKSDTVAYTYKIERGDGRKRSLAIMHPSVQLQFIDFYKKYDGYVINQCSKSHYSLRFPLQVGSVYYERDLAIYDKVFSNQGDLAPSDDKEQRMFASSYFYYARYNRIWRFYDSTEFRRLEQDYRLLWTLDISKCFPTIYTHSISWAVRSKEFAKQNRKNASFDSKFDELMQRSNWGETNGILVGPEISRIFAEIVLQKIDADFRNSWIGSGRSEDEVAIRRYVDDYLIFANNDETMEYAKKILEACLEKYNLTLNEAKTNRLKSPLISNLSIARDAIKTLLEAELFPLLAWLRTNDEANAEKPIRKPGERASDALIRRIKATIKQHDASYSTIVPYSLGMIARFADEELRRVQKSPPEDADLNTVYRTLSTLLEVAYFLYRMDPRVPTTYRVSSIILAISGIASAFGNLKNIVRREIIDQGMSVLRQFQRASMSGVEASCLLATLFYIGEPDAICASDLTATLKLDLSDTSKIDYFGLVTALYVAGNSEEHKVVRKAVSDHVVNLFAESKVPLHTRSEAVLIFFDMLACPHVDKSIKRLLVQSMSLSLSNQTLIEQKANEVINFVSANLGFCDWTDEVSLPAMLKRKELSPAYE